MNHLYETSILPQLLLISQSDWLIFYEKKGWFIEMVHADVIVGEISCLQKFFLATFFEQNLTLVVTNGKYYPTFELGFLRRL